MKHYQIVWVLLSLISVKGELIGQTLDDYILQALEANPGIHASKSVWMAAQQQAGKVGALPDPVLTGGVFLLPVETRVGPQLFKASVVQRFPWFGTISSRKEAANLHAASFAFRLESDEDQVVYRVRSSWYTLYGLERKLEVMQEDLEILHGLEALAIKRYEAGKTGLVDVIRVRLRIDEAETALDNVERRRVPYRSAFNALLNRALDEAVNLPDSLPLPGSSLPANTMANPALGRLEQQAAAFASEANLARKEGLPSFGLGLEYANVQQRVNVDLPDNGQDVLAPIASISLPIYRNKYDAAGSQAMLYREAAISQKTELALQFAAQFESAKWDALAATNRVALYDRQVLVAESALNILLTSYTSEQESFEEVLRMQQDILEFRYSRIDALVEAYHAQSRLQFLAGSR